MDYKKNCKTWLFQICYKLQKYIPDKILSNKASIGELGIEEYLISHIKPQWNCNIVNLLRPMITCSLYVPGKLHKKKGLIKYIPDTILSNKAFNRDLWFEEYLRS